MDTYTLYVMSNSPYSDKIRMYLRLKRLPVVEVRENLRNREDVLKARTGRTMVPVVITPGDEALNDSTQVTRRLEAACPSPALRPADAGRRGLTRSSRSTLTSARARDVASALAYEPDAEQNRCRGRRRHDARRSGIDSPRRRISSQGITATLPPMATSDTLRSSRRPARPRRRLDGLFA
jgi:glutathione S-transferase